MTRTTSFDTPDRRHILNPWIVGEGISTTEAATIARKSEDTIRRWCETKRIGRRVAAGQWVVSRPALEMVLAGDLEAHTAYLRGERGGVVEPYFLRARMAGRRTKEDKAPSLEAG